MSREAPFNDTCTAFVKHNGRRLIVVCFVLLVCFSGLSQAYSSWQAYVQEETDRRERYERNFVIWQSQAVANCRSIITTWNGQLAYAEIANCTITDAFGSG